MASNFPAFLAALEQLKQRIEDGSADGLRAWADDVMAVANVPVQSVPYDTGRLHDSASVEGPLTGNGRSTVRLAYDTDYALLVHEAPQSARKTGRSKWLEQTITGKADDLGPHLKAKVGA